MSIKLKRVKTKKDEKLKLGVILKITRTKKGLKVDVTGASSEELMRTAVGLMQAVNKYV